MRGAEGVEVTSTATKFESFMRRQPRDFQDMYFGRDRADQFHRGVPIRDMREDSGNVLTVDELNDLP